MAARLARARLAHPEWWVYALAALAWIALLATHVRSRSATDAAHAHQHAHDGYDHPAAAASIDRDVAESAVVFLLMLAAMMLPFVAPAVRDVARVSFWNRRQRAATSYVFGFLAVWTGFTLALFVVRAGLPKPGTDAGWLAAAAAAAALWQRSGPRRRFAARCGSRPALPQRGRRATWRTVQAGATFGVRCVPLCGPAMAIMAVSPELVVMVAAFGIQAYEWRRGPNPFAKRRWRGPTLAYGAIAVIAVVGLL